VQVVWQQQDGMTYLLAGLLPALVGSQLAVPAYSPAGLFCSSVFVIVLSILAFYSDVIVVD